MSRVDLGDMGLVDAVLGPLLVCNQIEAWVTNSTNWRATAQTAPYQIPCASAATSQSAPVKLAVQVRGRLVVATAQAQAQQRLAVLGQVCVELPTRRAQVIEVVVVEGAGEGG